MGSRGEGWRCFKLTVAYNGSRYSGWQWQPGETLSIQGQLEIALREITGESIRVAGSGRTDAGVHATGQVVSFSTDRWKASAERLIPALNRFLPSDIVVRLAEEAASHFHAIRDSKRKRYRYTIRNSRIADPHLGHLQWCLHRPLDIEAMRLAANHFLGEHDFVALQGQGSPRRNTVRNITRLDILVEPTWEGKLLQIDVTANGFLYNMVRNIVGTLVEVGHRKREPAWIHELLVSGDRCLAGQTAPAQGLCLAEVYYE